MEGNRFFRGLCFGLLVVSPFWLAVCVMVYFCLIGGR